MFGALGRVVTRFPWLVIAAWLVMAGLVITLAPKLTSTSDQASFLPDHYESIQATTIQQEKFPTNTTPGAIMVFERRDGGAMTQADLATADTAMKTLNGSLPETFAKSASPEQLAVQPTADKSAGIAIFGLSPDSTGFDTKSMDDAKKLREDAGKALDGTDVLVKIGGSPASSVDSEDDSAKTMEIVGAATIILIISLLALIFRSIIVCLLPVVVVGLVSQVATGLIAWANDVFDLKADSSVQVILIVVLYGIGTDYILFLFFRHRERLRMGEDIKTSMVGAMERAGEAIASAGGAVIVAFMALILSSLGIFKSIGPALAIAVAVTLLAALTLVPAVATVFGKQLFKPSMWWHHGILILGTIGALFTKDVAVIVAIVAILAIALELIPFLWGLGSRALARRKEGRAPKPGAFERIGDGLGKRPAVFAAASGGVLVILSLFALQFHPSFDFNSSIPKDLESSQAMAKLQESFGQGAADPAIVVLKSDSRELTQAEVDTFAASLHDAPGTAALKAGEKATGQLSADKHAAIVSLTLADDPSSDAASASVEGPVRDKAHEAAASIGAQAFVGGTTSVFVDIDKAMVRDYTVVFPVAAAIILLILALLLRSLVAPWYLMLSVGLGFTATLGATVLVIQHIKGDNGLIFMLPIYIYLFVVALGTDYNILMIARLREEAREGKAPRAAAAEAVKHAGPTIAAAGLILAGTFASLMLGGNSLIVSMGFALSFGIFVAAFIMAMFFTPAITALIGHLAWWPGHGDETAEEHEARVGHGH